MGIQRRQKGDGNQGKPVDLDKSLFAKNFPSLFQFLRDEMYEDGTSRQTATITLFVSPQGFQACLNDRDQGQATFVTCGTVDGLWAALDKGLAEDSLQWRPSKQQFKGRPKK